MNNWQYIIEEALKGDLPGEKSHRKMLLPGHELTIPDDNRKVKPSGVLMLIYPDGNDLFTCLIKRHSNLKNHAGQIGFPGGKMEKSDDSPQLAAVRETSEEIGIQPDEILTIGALSPLYIPVSSFLIYPFVAWSSSKPQFMINRNEVERLLLFPLLNFFNNRKITGVILETVTGRLNVPSFQYDGETVWGLPP